MIPCYLLAFLRFNGVMDLQIWLYPIDARTFRIKLSMAASR